MEKKIRDRIKQIVSENTQPIDIEWWKRYRKKRSELSKAWKLRERFNLNENERQSHYVQTSLARRLPLVIDRFKKG